MDKRLSIGYALDSYLPITYTWIYSLFHHIDKFDITFFSACYEPHASFPLLAKKDIVTCPGYIKRPTGKFGRIPRGLCRVLIYNSGLCDLYFCWAARARSIKLVHAHFGIVGWRYIRLSKMLNVPLVVSFYGYDYDYLIKKSPVWRRRYKKLFAHAAMILTEGEYGRASLIAKGCDPQKVTVQHLGVDTDRIPFKERQYQTDEKLKLIQVARFAEKKGHRIFVEAVKILRDEGLADKLSVLLVGTGPLKEEILSYLHRNDLSDTVHVRDFIPYTQLHIELLSYHALVQPSLTASDSDCEGGAPVTLLDAQASGLPVISTYHCDISEVVLEGITGLLVPEKSSIDLANAIKYVISNPSCISRFSSACREHIRRNYSGERQARRMEEIYQHLIF